MFWFFLIKIGKVIYKNKFCGICNFFNFNFLGKRCDINFKNISIFKVCEEFLDIKLCFLYKNVFCKLCSCGKMNFDCYIEIIGLLGYLGYLGIYSLVLFILEIFMFRIFFILDVYKN